MKKVRILLSLLALCLVTVISAFAFTSCFGPDEEFEAIYDENGNDTGNARLISVSTRGEYTVPESWEGRPVTEIGPEAFKGSNRMTKLNIPSCVELIDLQSLKWFGMYLEEINYMGEGNYKTIDGILYSKGGEELLIYPKAHPAKFYQTPDCVKRIAVEGAISEVKYLEEIVIGENVEKMGDWALNLQLSDGRSPVRKLSIPARFLGHSESEMFTVTATDVKELVITSGQAIPDNALSQFDHCVEKVVLPEGLKRIGDHFTAQKLKEVVIPETVEHIGIDFCLFSMIEEIKLPEGLQTLGRSSFGNCDYLKEITIPDSVKISGEGWILGGGIKKLTAPLSVMQRVSFDEMELEEAVVTRIGTLTDDVWQTEINAKHVVFGTGVLSIPYDRIRFSESVEKVTVLGNLTSLSSDMLVESAVSKIILPESVTYINAASLAVRSDVNLTVCLKGSEGSCNIDESELSIPENVSIVWDYEDPIEPPCQMEVE